MMGDDDYDHLHRWEPSAFDARWPIPERPSDEPPRLRDAAWIAGSILAGLAVAGAILGIAWLVALLTHASTAWTAPWVG